jgi:ParB family transcriptional regulator, chromosome partitioning protein
MQFSQAKTRYVAKIDKSQVTKPRASVYTESFKGEFYNISIEKLIPFKNQARKFFDEESIISLSETIKEHGVRQPLTIIASDIKEGCYEVISGERRLRAAKLAGLKQVPCIIIHDMLKAEEIALIENIQRQDLHPIELMKAFSSLLQNGTCSTHSEIAKKVGMSRTSIIDIMNLSSLSAEAQDILIQSNINGRDFLRRLIKLSEGEQKLLIDSQLKVIETKKARTITKKRQILSISYYNDCFEILQNNITKLPIAKQQELKSMLLQLLL